MADSWFSYLQIQICKAFEFLENNKLNFLKETGKKIMKRRWRNILSYYWWKNF